MSNIKKVKRKKVTVELDDGVKRQLKFTNEAAGMLEERFGSLEEAFTAFGDGKMEAINYFLYAGCVAFDEEVTLKYVTVNTDMRDMAYYIQEITKALSTDVPMDEKEKSEVKSEAENAKVLGEEKK